MKLKDLKKMYKKALIENKTSFIFQDKEILTTYAKYLIQYLETKGVEDDHNLKVI